MEEAARAFGWPAYYIQFLLRAGHLKPLGKPAQNARKWSASVELERLSNDANWLDKAIRIIEKRIQDMNGKQKGKSVACLKGQTRKLAGVTTPHETLTMVSEGYIEHHPDVGETSGDPSNCG